MTTMSDLDLNERFTSTIATKGVGKTKQKLPGITRSSNFHRFTAMYIHTQHDCIYRKGCKAISGG